MENERVSAVSGLNILLLLLLLLPLLLFILFSFVFNDYHIEIHVDFTRGINFHLTPQTHSTTI